jgi:hypothetical protein
VEFELIGVEEMKIDCGANKLIAVGTMDPWKLRDWIEKKTNHKAEILVLQMSIMLTNKHKYNIICTPLFDCVSLISN